MTRVKLVIILMAAIFIWRGTWGLVDTYLSPDNQALSYFAAILLGLILLKVAHLSLKHIE